VKVFIFLMVVLTGLKMVSAQTESVYKVYFLAGQSNMVGVGKVAELPDSLNKEFADVYIFHGSSIADGDVPGGKGIWANLRPGHGFLFGSDGVNNSYTDLFGPELSFAQYMRTHDVHSRIAIVKYARVGTSIDSAASMGFGYWDPLKKAESFYNQFDHFKETVVNALKPTDIDGDGQLETLVPAGIIWMQGESDAAYTKEIALRYEENLTNLIQAMRKLLKNENLPVVIGRISDSGQDADGKQWDYADIVRDAQQSFTEKDSNAALVDTDSYGFSDIAHYDSQGFISLGNDFAKAILELRP